MSDFIPTNAGELPAIRWFINAPAPEALLFEASRAVPLTVLPLSEQLNQSCRRVFAPLIRYYLAHEHGIFSIGVGLASGIISGLVYSATIKLLGLMGYDVESKIDAFQRTVAAQTNSWVLRALATLRDWVVGQPLVLALWALSYHMGWTTRRTLAMHLMAKAAGPLFRVWLKSQETPIGSEWVSFLLRQTMRRPAIGSAEIREVAAKIPTVQAATKEAHTHGRSAADRGTASATAGLIARAIGLEPYFVQMSLPDQRRGRRGDRSYHWAKDLGAQAREFHFDGHKHAAVMIDVDHYLDMPEFLAKHPGTYLIYTFTPTMAAKGAGEYSFRFLEDNSVLYHVSGGATYHHGVWDYGGDTILVTCEGYLLNTAVAYHIDRVSIDAHHSLVILTVLGAYDYPRPVPVEWLVPGKPLTRLRPVRGKFVCLDVLRTSGLTKSIAMLGEFMSVEVSAEQHAAIVGVARASKVTVTAAMVASNIAPRGPNGLPTGVVLPGHGAILANYLREEVPTPPPLVFPAEHSVQVLQYSPHDYTEAPHLKAFGSPLIDPCYVQTDGPFADDRCIRGRVEKFHVATDPEIDPQLALYIGEFIGLVIPDAEAHMGHPVGHDEVFERQPRPSQRHILEEASYLGQWAKNVVKSFLKKETYVKVTDPRNISTIAGKSKLLYSTFMYAFAADVVKDKHWYAFGRTPSEIADRVVELLTFARFCCLADGSRWDGHVNFLMRILERGLMLRWAHPEYHAELNELMDKQMVRLGVTAYGRFYDTGLTRLSGSPETSVLNTVGDAFISYVALRRSIDPTTGAYYTPEAAYAALGLYGGDDSIVADIEPGVLARAALDLGQDFEVKVVHRGELGVEFLNRHFSPEVWTGDTSSMSHPHRLLAKLWVGPVALKDPLERFFERVAGYARMDLNSPVIGRICQVAIATAGARGSGPLTPWHGDVPVEDNWPNTEGDWMLDVFSKYVPSFDWARFTEWIATIEYTQDTSLFLKAPLCVALPVSNPTVKEPTIVGEELVAPGATTAPSVFEDDTEFIGPDPPVDTPQPELTAAQTQVVEHVVAIAALVPQTDAVGKQERNPPKPTLRARSQVPLTAPAWSKSGKPVEKTAAVHDETNPNTWNPPLGNKPERLTSWCMKRAFTALRNGVLDNLKEPEGPAKEYHAAAVQKARDSARHAAAKAAKQAKKAAQKAAAKAPAAAPKPGAKPPTVKTVAPATPATVPAVIVTPPPPTEPMSDPPQEKQAGTKPRDSQIGSSNGEITEGDDFESEYIDLIDQLDRMRLRTLGGKRKLGADEMNVIDILADMAPSAKRARVGYAPDAAQSISAPPASQTTRPLQPIDARSNWQLVNATQPFTSSALLARLLAETPPSVTLAQEMARNRAGRAQAPQRPPARQNAPRRQQQQRRGKQEARPKAQMAPTSVTYDSRSSAPVQQMQGSGRTQSIRVKHREYVAELTAADASFQGITEVINPGLTQSFPWLSKIADNYEEYEINALSVEFVSRLPTTVTGSVVICPDYDATDPAPTSMVEALGKQGFVEGAAWRSLRCNLSVGAMRALSRIKYVRSGNVVGDIKTYDAAHVFVGCEGASVTGSLGKIFVDYDITLKVPVVESATQTCTSASIVKAGVFGPDSTFIANPPFPNTNTNFAQWSLTSCNALGVKVSSDNTGIILPKGSYKFEFSGSFIFITTNGSATSGTQGQIFVGLQGSNFTALGTGHYWTGGWAMAGFDEDYIAQVNAAGALVIDCSTETTVIPAFEFQGCATTSDVIRASIDELDIIITTV